AFCQHPLTHEPLAALWLAHRVARKALDFEPWPDPDRHPRVAAARVLRAFRAWPLPLVDYRTIRDIEERIEQTYRHRATPRLLAATGLYGLFYRDDPAFAFHMLCEGFGPRMDALS